MLADIYDRINDYGSVKIALAGPNDIRSWSFGEVRKPETINYRTYRPEKDGLFCERIFGPERDWECACGKYKGTKFKGIVCDRCGVKVTHSRVRRKRMGHINLAAPVVHIWFFKAIPNHLGTLLAMKALDLEKIIYFQDYVVTDPGQSPLTLGQLLSEEEYREAFNKYGSSFRALMGAEAIKALLANLNLDALDDELRSAIAKTSSVQRAKTLIKRLKTVDSIRSSGNKPEWMVLEVIPVIPPDLRPLVLLESGNFATSDLNDLYRRIINRNNRLKKLIDLNAPEVIIRNEKRMLQQAVDSLLDNGRCRRAVLGSNNRPLKSLTDMIKGKQGRFRENLLGKRVDYSARSVIVVGPSLKLYQCGLPKKIAMELYQPFIIRRLKHHGLADTIKSAKRMIERRDDEVWDVLEEVIHQHPVLLNRAPTLHRMGIQAFEPVLVEGNAIMLHPLACKGFNADFDGDQMAVHLPLSIEAQAETHSLMMATSNIFSPANGLPMVGPSQDMVMGNYYLTHMSGDVGAKGYDRVFKDTFEAMLACEMGKVSLQTKIKVRIDKSKMVVTEDGAQEPPSNEQAAGRLIETTVGRCIFNDMLSPQMPFYNTTMSQKALSRVISDCFSIVGSAETVDLLDKIKFLGFKYATLAGLSFGLTDLKIPAKKQDIINEAEERVARIHRNYRSGVLTEGERYNQVIDAWTHARVSVTNEMMKSLKEDIVEECESHEREVGYGLRVSKEDREKFKGWDSVILRLKNADGGVYKEVTVNITDTFQTTCPELRKKEIGDWLLSLKKVPWPKGKPPEFLMVQSKEGNLFDVYLKDNAPAQEKGIKVTAWSNKKQLNPIYVMTDSGARGSVDQIQQLAGMRALMAKPSGEIIETPIKANFREGLTILEYFSSTHGARKGLADTALKTANSGYLTRKLIDVAQNVIIMDRDCGTLQGITKSKISSGEQIDIPLSQLIIGRTARDNIRNPIRDEMIVRENEVITPEMAAKIESLGLDAIRVRSSLTCDCPYGICARCYGWDMSTGRLVEEGLAVGIVAAQSIGEPGTQLTLRTFHTGGVASRAILESDQKAAYDGIVQYRDLNAVEEPIQAGDFTDERGKDYTIGTSIEKDTGKTHDRPFRRGRVVLKRNGEIAILDDKNRELEKYKVPYGAYILPGVEDGHKVKSGQRLFRWDPHRTPILAEVSGRIAWVDIVEGETIRVEEEHRGQAGRMVVIEHKGDKHPQIIIEEGELGPEVEWSNEFRVKDEEGQKKAYQLREKLLDYAFNNIITQVKWLTPDQLGVNIKDPDDKDEVKKVLRSIEAEIVRELNPRLNNQKEKDEKSSADIQHDILEVVERIIDAAKDEKGWVNCSDDEAQELFRKGHPEVPESPGIYFFRKRGEQLKSGYIGYVGVAGIESEKGLRFRLSQHFNPQRNDNFPKRIAEFIRDESPRRSSGKILDVHYLPAGARIEVEEGHQVQAGQLLAHQPRATGGTQDITGGLPRVTEVFEARRPKDPAAMAEISGRVELRSDKRKGKMTVIIRSESGMEKEHHIPRDRHLNVHTGDMVEAGASLTDGPLVPQDILHIKGEDALQRYLISEVQNVYRSQNVNINDKHIEIIISQMMRKVEIESVGDSSFLPGEVVDKFEFRQENERLANSVKVTGVGDSTQLQKGQIVSKEEFASINEKLESLGAAKAVGKKPKPATAKTLLLGITKASLQSDSFIAAASFQETTKVLTEASLAGKVDRLAGLKENVILGHLIPAGTAFKPYLEMKVKHLVEAPLPKVFEEVKEAKLEEAKAEAAVREALGI